MLAANFSFYTGFFPRPGGPVDEGRHAAVPLRHAGRLRVLSRSRRPEGGQRGALPAGQYLLGGQPRAPHLRRVLEGARDRAAPARRDAGRADRRRLVRRRGSGRAAAHLSRHRAPEPVDVEPARDGAVGARRLVARRRRSARRARLRRQDRRRVPRRFERPFFEHHLRDAALAEAPEAAVFVTGENAWRTPPAWPPADATRATFFLREGGALAEAAPSCARRSRPSTSTSAIRTGRCRTCPTPGPACAATT